MDYTLEIEGLGKQYKGFALEDVSFKVPQGYIMGLIGPNGAGKTTIIKLIMNLIRRNSGRIRVFGKDNIAHEVEVKSRIGFVYDTPCFHQDVSLQEIASSIAPFYPGWDERLFRSLMSEFELPPRKKFKKLSHGMQTKFSLALALSHDAEFIIMDEPTAGLDPLFRRELLERLSGVMQDERKAILFSTHITTDLERVADYITFINDGRLVFSSSKDEVFENWAVVKGGAELLQPEMRGLFRGIRRTEYGVAGLTSDSGEARRRLGPAAVIDRAGLQDIMFLTGQGNHGSSSGA